MKISDLQKNCYINDSDMEEFKECNPKQIISDDIMVPIWKASYSYTTNRGNYKKAIKYLLLPDNYWDAVENYFNMYIERFNNKYPDRKLSNVKILDIDYLGEVFIELEQ